MQLLTFEVHFSNCFLKVWTFYTVIFYHWRKEKNSLTFEAKWWTKEKLPRIFFISYLHRSFWYFANHCRNYNLFTMVKSYHCSSKVIYDLISQPTLKKREVVQIMVLIREKSFYTMAQRRKNHYSYCWWGFNSFRAATLTFQYY